ncbi:hypothetical protein D3C73_1291780 [compost metagenome]
MFGVCHFDRRQIFKVFQLDQGNIGTWILADHLGVKFTAVVQLDLNFIGVIYHVIVGHHVAFSGINHHPGAQRLEFLLGPLTRCTRLATLTHRRSLERRTVLAER